MGASYDLFGRNAIVTGGARGIGRAIAERLLASGARVCTWDIDPVAMKGVDTWQVDVTQREQVDRAVARYVEQHARIDIMVNDAGYLGTLHPFDAHDPADWQRIIRINLIGMLQVAQAVIPHMKRAGGGRIVNLGSLAGKEGLANLVAYSAASGGVVAFTKALGRELAGTGIYVNCVAPGPIDTDMIRNLGDTAVQAMINDSPLKRLGSADEVAHLVAWLCSDASSFNTGAVFDMSGGRARY
jgi:3-oxoacyl-[acyl-carrier protein] reductase